MRIFNETKTTEIKEPDLDKGYLVDDQLQVGESEPIAEVEEQGHYEVEKEYENGGKDMRWVVDVPYVPPSNRAPIYEDIKVYLPYSQTVIKEKADEKFYMENKTEMDELNELLAYLDETDFKAIQFSEGVLSAEDFEPIKLTRQATRQRVREIQSAFDEKRGGEN